MCRLEFDKIGALGIPTKEGQDISVCHRPLPIELLLQEVEGLDSTYFFPKGKTFDTSLDYTIAMLRLANNLFQRTPNPDLGSTDEDARKTVYAYFQFCTCVARKFVRRDLNNGPFVLMHGDMNLHAGNLWNETLNLVSVIDWEWSYTVPVQCFIQPAWLSGFHSEPIDFIASSGRPDYSRAVMGLCLGIGDRVGRGLPDTSLRRAWMPMVRNSRHLIVLALLYPAHVYGVYWRSVDFLSQGEKMGPSMEDEIKYAVEYAVNLPKRLDDFFITTEGINESMRAKLSRRDRFDEEYEVYLANNGGEPQICRCERCREHKEIFDNMRQLPFTTLLGSDDDDEDSEEYGGDTGESDKDDDQDEDEQVNNEEQAKEKDTEFTSRSKTKEASNSPVVLD